MESVYINQLNRIRRIETENSITIRLESAKDAQARSRVVFITICVVCLMMIIASYNAYISYNSAWVLERAAGGSQLLDTRAADRVSYGPIIPQQLDPARAIPNILTEQAMKDWVQSRTVSISLLGIRVDIDDAPILGSIALFVISIWLVLAFRRENYTIGFLLRDTQKNDQDSAAVVIESLPRRWEILHSVVGNTVFTNFNKAFAPVGTLSGDKAMKPNVVLASLFHLFSSFVFGLPAFTQFFVFYFDRRSYFLRSAFNFHLENPGVRANSSAIAAFFNLSFFFFVVFLVAVIINCVVAFIYNMKTEHMISSYFEQIKEDLENDAIW